MATLSNQMLFLLLSCFAILRYGNADGEIPTSNIKELKDKLFKNYDKDTAPVSPQGHKGTTVIYDILPRCIIDLDEEKSAFTLDFYFVIEWIDPRLEWNAADYGGLNLLQVPTNTVWVPDFRIFKGSTSTMNPMRTNPVYVKSDGLVIWDMPESATVFCDVTTYLGSYPSDTPECNVTVDLFPQRGAVIELEFQPARKRWTRFWNTHPRWELDIEKSSISKATLNFSMVKEPFVTTIDATFALRRRPPVHLKVLWTPTVLTMILTLAMFWIPTNSGKKITLGLALLIILVIITAYCAAVERSPQASLLAVPFIQSTAIAVASAVALEILILGIGRISGPRRPPPFVVGLLSGSVGDYMCMRTWWKQSSAGTKARMLLDNECQREWLIVATFFDKILFVLYIVVFAAIHC